MPMPIANTFAGAARLTGIFTKPLMWFIPGLNVAKSIGGWTKTIKRSVKMAGFGKQIRKSFYSGDKFFDVNMRKYLEDFSDRLDVSSQTNLTDWISKTTRPVGFARTGRIDPGRALGESVVDIFYKTIKGDIHTTDVRTLISNTFRNRGLPFNEVGDLAGYVKAGKEAAYETFKAAGNSIDLLTGPRLMSNAAVLALPTLTSAVTTSALIRTIKRRSESIYDGYTGNVF